MQGVWRLLGPLGSVFGVLFPGLYPERSPKGLLEGTELDFGSILEGTALDFGSILEGTELDFGCLLKGCLGVVWGGLWEGFGRVWRVKNCSFLGI